ncbi:hypothetical protein OG223_21850 [Streptomyces sp. NBC_01478]|uniref:hypothetical protein n=1 Tax=Streptomyces sp. NBC_01478 TaxID=2903882 RepID=UPI002E31F134|nr:hypothetical protein [Streptomyces sp. NBC_01478]
MSTLLFVHGTGVRDEGVRAVVSLLRRKLAPLRPDVTVTACSWGTEEGARLHAGGASVPGYDRTRTTQEAEPDPVDSWLLLYADPLHELRLAGVGEGTDPPPGAVLPGEHAEETVRALLARDDSGRLRERADAADLTGRLPDALAAVLDTDAWADARTALANDPGLPLLLARAAVAEAVRSPSAGPAAVEGDGGARDGLVEALAEVLGGSPPGADPRSVASRVGLLTARTALRLGAARAVERRRGALTDAAHPAAGDVLRYLTRGDGIRAVLARRIAECAAEEGGPVTVLGHSLGGIAAVDLLAGRPRPDVARLITVGSQAPFLYEIDALPSLPFGSGLPPGFPPWTNVYDPRDLLAFVAAPLFPGRARDVRLDSRQPFPYAHSAYWSRPELYPLLARELP